MKLFKKKEPKTFEELKRQIQKPVKDNSAKLEKQRIKKELKKYPRKQRKKMLEVYELYKADGKILIAQGNE